jgi:transcriptional regulator of PTS gene
VRIEDSILNRLRVIKAILRHGPVARSDLPGLTGLSTGLISQQTAQLVRTGLVRESRSNAVKGRPRMLLEINERGGVVLGVSLTAVGTLQAAFVDFSAKRLFECEMPIEQTQSLSAFATCIAVAIERAIDQSPFASKDISRVGIALPALVDSLRGNVHFLTTFPPDCAPFAVPISARLGVPVTIENPLDSLARAEHWFGKATRLQDFSLIRVGMSVDCAEFEDGLPKYGPNGLSSSFGHAKVSDEAEARPCFCGGRGCMTNYVGTYGILQAADRLRGLSFPPIVDIQKRFKALIAEAAVRHGPARDAIDLAGRKLGFCVANYINSMNPSHVLITIDDPCYAKLIAAPFREALARNAMPGVLGVTNLEFIPLNPEWWWLGTAALAMEQLHLSGS